MEVRIETIAPRKLAGMRIRTTLAANQTAELWRGFMPRRKQIANARTGDLYSVEVYDASLDFNDFNPGTPFDKWAAVEVSDFNALPQGMEPLTVAGGRYAVFLYKGPANQFQQAFGYIFGTWFPNSAYNIDGREHFAIMGEKYKGNDPSSEEEIWIPVQPKQ